MLDSLLSVLYLTRAYVLILHNRVLLIFVELGIITINSNETAYDFISHIREI